MTCIPFWRRTALKPEREDPFGASLRTVRVGPVPAEVVMVVVCVVVVVVLLVLVELLVDVAELVVVVVMTVVIVVA